MLRVVLVCCAVILGSTPVAHAQSDDDFMAAREAFRTGNRAKVAAYAERLRDHLLYPYVAYWQIRPRLDEVSPDEVRELLARLADGPLADRLRNDWLKALGRRGLWDVFQTEHVGLRSEDPEVGCYALQRRIAAGEAEALRAGRALWLSTRSSPEPCNLVFEAAIQAGVIRNEEIWLRIRSALEAGQVTQAKATSRYLPARDNLDAKALDAAVANPRASVERMAPDPMGSGARAIAIFAIQRLARTTPQEAAARFRMREQSFPPAEREYVWAQLGTHAAMVQDPDALGYFARGGRLNDHQLAWRARAGLRAKQWNEVQASIDAMSDSQRAEPEWRYWKARVLHGQRKVVEANAIFAPLSTEHHFYGLLAAEELGERIGPPGESYRPNDAEIQEVAGLPAIRRALALYRLGLRFEGHREWFWAIATMDDRQLLATAEFARRNELWDRAINTAERTRSVHDFSLRYLAPYRDRFRSYAQEHGLDEAWVFGIARQESRFISDARSSAGAMGLMQLMPATARWVAGKLGIKGFRQAIVTDLDINISLGTYYLKHVMEVLDHQPVLASAGYNAGPGRAQAWRPYEEMEGAIYAESIPFNETRDYVKKVMANAVYYARTFGQGVTSLKERIGWIPPRTRAAESGR